MSAIICCRSCSTVVGEKKPDSNFPLGICANCQDWTWTWFGSGWMQLGEGIVVVLGNPIDPILIIGPPWGADYYAGN